MQSPDNSPSPHESLTSFSKVGKYARNLKKTNLQRLKAGEAPEPDGHLVFKKTNLQRLKAGEEPEANGHLKLKKTNPQRLKAVEEPEADGHLKLKKTNLQRLKAGEEPEANGHLKLYDFYFYLFFLFICLFQWIPNGSLLHFSRWCAGAIRILQSGSNPGSESNIYSPFPPPPHPSSLLSLPFAPAAPPYPPPSPCSRFPRPLSSLGGGGEEESVSR